MIDVEEWSISFRDDTGQEQVVLHWHGKCSDCRHLHDLNAPIQHLCQTEIGLIAQVDEHTFHLGKPNPQWIEELAANDMNVEKLVEIAIPHLLVSNIRTSDDILH